MLLTLVLIGPQGQLSRGTKCTGVCVCVLLTLSLVLIGPQGQLSRGAKELLHHGCGVLEDLREEQEGQRVETGPLCFLSSPWFHFLSRVLFGSLFEK